MAQPDPVATDQPPIWPLVIADMHGRDLAGLGTYGVRLTAFNGRDPLLDAYEECLDQAVYLRAAIAERDSLVAEVRRLRAQVAGHCERIAAQSELLSRRAER